MDKIIIRRNKNSIKFERRDNKNFEKKKINLQKKIKNALCYG
jgi:hypothetical protein